jgi:hypothetical protein
MCIIVLIEKKVCIYYRYKQLLPNRDAQLAAITLLPLHPRPQVVFLLSQMHIPLNTRSCAIEYKPENSFRMMLNLEHFVVNRI